MAGAPLHDAATMMVGLSAVIIAADDAGETGRAYTLITRDAVGLAALPFGPFDPTSHRTFELALRAFVRDQTGFELGYVEQLYTFGDRGREAPLAQLTEADVARVISVGYLALAPAPLNAPTGGWADWYRYFPWEDHRAGRPAALERVIAPALRGWADGAEGQGRRAARWDRARAAFGLDGAAWNEERVLERYELLYEAQLTPEAMRDAGLACASHKEPAPAFGEAMASDHRRILATAISRLRAKIKYRPVVFELMGETFTLSALQRTTETILGLALHKQNFRRALTASKLVAGTGQQETQTGGRPAELFRFRREVLREGPTLGVAAPRLKES